MANTLEQYRHRGKGPAFVKAAGKQGVTRGRYSGAVRYREQDLLDWHGESREESA
jgi:hypothetical protein